MKPAIRIPVSLAAIIFLCVFPHYSGSPLIYVPAGIVVCWLYLTLTGNSFATTGFRFRALNFSSFYIGGFAGGVYAFLQLLFIGPFFDRISGQQDRFTAFDYIRNSLPNYLFLLALAWLVVIPYEEIVFRGFILPRIGEMFLPKYRAAAATLLSCVLFALYHIQEGISAVMSIFIFSLVITWLYRRARYNLWYAIFFHAVYDTVLLTAIRTGKL